MHTLASELEIKSQCGFRLLTWAARAWSPPKQSTLARIRVRSWPSAMYGELSIAAGSGSDSPSVRCLLFVYRQILQEPAWLGTLVQRLTARELIAPSGVWRPDGH